MHMADALISPAVGLAMDAVSAAAIGLSVAKVNKDEQGDKKIPMMGVAGAMVFAAQMINFAIPGTGSSGHIGGGVLLAGLLGGAPAFLSITAVLIIQCLFFADGGLLALGCNIFNMGVIPCLLVYPLVFKTLIRGRASLTRLTLASVISGAAALELGALCVTLQTLLSGVTALPFGLFASLMLPIHLAIGLVEGVVTAAALCFVYKARPELIEATQSGLTRVARPELIEATQSGLTRAARPGKGFSGSEDLGGAPTKKLLIVLVSLTILIGGILTMFASTRPDGLEWAIGKVRENTVGASVSGIAGAATAGVSASGITGGTAGASASGIAGAATGASASGIIGAAATFALAGATGAVISFIRKRKSADKKS